MATLAWPAFLPLHSKAGASPNHCLLVGAMSNTFTRWIRPRREAKTRHPSPVTDGKRPIRVPGTTRIWLLDPSGFGTGAGGRARTLVDRPKWPHVLARTNKFREWPCGFRPRPRKLLQEKKSEAWLGEDLFFTPDGKLADGF